MKHSDYIAYFRDIATRQPDLKHTDDECHFVRVIYSEWPQPNIQLEEYLAQHKSGLRYPFLMCETWTKRVIAESSENMDNVYKGSFFIGDQLTEKGNYDAQEVLFDKTDRIAEDITAYLLYEFEQHRNGAELPKRHLIEDSIRQEHIGPFNQDKYGTRVEFQYTMSKARVADHEPSTWIQTPAALTYFAYDNNNQVGPAGTILPMNPVVNAGALVAYDELENKPLPAGWKLGSNGVISPSVPANGVYDLAVFGEGVFGSKGQAVASIRAYITDNLGFLTKAKVITRDERNTPDRQLNAEVGPDVQLNGGGALELQSATEDHAEIPPFIFSEDYFFGFNLTGTSIQWGSDLDALAMRNIGNDLQIVLVGGGSVLFEDALDFSQTHQYYIVGTSDSMSLYIDGVLFEYQVVNNYPLAHRYIGKRGQAFSDHTIDDLVYGYDSPSDSDIAALYNCGPNEYVDLVKSLGGERCYTFDDAKYGDGDIITERINNQHGTFHTIAPSYNAKILTSEGHQPEMEGRNVFPALIGADTITLFDNEQRNYIELEETFRYASEGSDENFIRFNGDQGYFNLRSRDGNDRFQALVFNGEAVSVVINYGQSFNPLKGELITLRGIYDNTGLITFTVIRVTTGESWTATAQSNLTTGLGTGICYLGGNNIAYPISAKVDGVEYDIDFPVAKQVSHYYPIPAKTPFGTQDLINLDIKYPIAPGIINKIGGFFDPTIISNVGNVREFVFALLVPDATVDQQIMTTGNQPVEIVGSKMVNSDFAIIHTSEGLNQVQSGVWQKWIFIAEADVSWSDLQVMGDCQIILPKDFTAVQSAAGREVVLDNIQDTINKIPS